VDGEITCLSLGVDDTIWMGVRKGSQTLLAHGSLQEHLDDLQIINLAERKPVPSSLVFPQLCPFLTLRRCARTEREHRSLRILPSRRH
jgi:hypothetical protein